MRFNSPMRRDLAGMPEPERLPPDATLSEVIEAWNAMAERTEREQQTESVPGPYAESAEAAADAQGKLAQQVRGLDGRVAHLESVTRASPVSEPKLVPMDKVGVSGNDSNPDWLHDKLPSFDGTDSQMSYQVVVIDADGDEITPEVGASRVQRLRIIAPHPEGSGIPITAFSTGAPSTILVMDGTTPTWADPDTVLLHNLLSARHSDAETAAGAADCIIVGDGDGNWAQLVPSTGNCVLMLDVSQAAGSRIRWVGLSTNVCPNP